VTSSLTRSADVSLTLSAQAWVGTTLRGKYRLDGVIGVGAIGAVYAATHRNSKRFAVKMLHPHLSMNEDIRGRFLREGYAANRVAHSGTVTVLDDDVTDDGIAFLVMELLEGLAVDVLAERCGERLSVAAAVTIVDQLLEVLAAAHANDIIHRDIKPANLFVTTDGRLKVLDFGIARARDALGGGDGASTNVGMLLGTPAFMAPEQARAQSEEVGPQTDLWAASATLFTLITGELVHPGENQTMMLVHAATRSARPLTSAPFQVPTPIAAVVDRGLAFAKEDRWATATAMREALRASYRAVFDTLPTPIPIAAFGFDAGPPSIVPAPGALPAPTPPAKRSHRVLIVTGSALILGVAWVSYHAASKSTVALSQGVPTAAGSASQAASAQPSPAQAGLNGAQDPATSGQTSSAAPIASSPAKKAATSSAALNPSLTPVLPMPQPRAAAARPSATVSCTPPYHFDAEGNQVFNKECL
jgi:serine/threonine protein kinase